MKPTSNVYKKHLTLDKRIKIEKGIDEKKNFTQIANDICKSKKTVSNEILRKIKKSGKFGPLIGGIVRCSATMWIFSICN